MRGNEDIAMSKKKWNWMAVAFMCMISVFVLTGCGDEIKKDTVTEVKEKTQQALELYADIEKMAAENSLVPNQSFLDMKTKLTDMSGKVQAGIEETTEEDGQLTLQQLERIIKNLQEVKDSVSASLEGNN